MIQEIALPFFQQLLHLDYQLMLLINRLFIHPYMDTISLFMRESIFHIPLYVFIILFAFSALRSKAVWWLLAGILLIICCDLISSHVIKDLVGRPRPCRDPFMAGNIRLLASYCGGNGSFTSSHAVNHFAFATYVFTTLKSFSPWFRVLFIWAALIAYSQVYVGVHYPSDVLVGAILGCLFGWLCARIVRQSLSLHQYKL
jgi:membrane-associated phospholipid phosphatase